MSETCERLKHQVETLEQEQARVQEEVNRLTEQVKTLKRMRRWGEEEGEEDGQDK